jgi:hypothetical protein
MERETACVSVSVSVFEFVFEGGSRGAMRVPRAACRETRSSVRR